MTRGERRERQMVISFSKDAILFFLKNNIHHTMRLTVEKKNCKERNDFEEETRILPSVQKLPLKPKHDKILDFVQAKYSNLLLY